MHPRLKPALLRLWRDATTLQLGLPPGRSAILTAADEDVVLLLDRLDGTRTYDDIVGSLTTDSDGRMTAQIARDLIDELVAGGLVDDAATSTEALHRSPAVDRARLHDDMRAWSLATSSPAGAHGVLARRRRAWVDIRSQGRVGFACAQLLAAAGIGRLTVTDAELVIAERLAPLGPRVEHLGSRMSHALNDELARHAPATKRTPRMSSGPDLTLVVSSDPMVDREIVDDLMRRDAIHLCIVERGGGLVIGPLVHPGRSACTRCADLMLGDHDPSWRWLGTQLRTLTRTAREGSRAHDSVLGTAAAAMACLQILTQIDGDERPVLVDAIGRLALPQGAMEVTHVSPHPACGCTWPGQMAVADARRRQQPRTMAT